MLAGVVNIQATVGGNLFDDEVRFYYEDLFGKRVLIGAVPTPAPGPYSVEWNTYESPFESPNIIYAELADTGNPNPDAEHSVVVQIAYPELSYLNPEAEHIFSGPENLSSEIYLPPVEELTGNTFGFEVRYFYQGTIHNELGASRTAPYELLFDPYALGEKYPSPGVMRAEVWALDQAGEYLSVNSLDAINVHPIYIDYLYIDLISPEPGTVLSDTAKINSYIGPALISTYAFDLIDHVEYWYEDVDPANPDPQLIAEVPPEDLFYSWDLYSERLAEEFDLQAKLILTDWAEPIDTDSIHLYIDYTEFVEITSPTEGATVEGLTTLTAEAETWRRDGIDKVEYWLQDRYDSTQTVKLGESVTAPYTVTWDTNDGREYYPEAVLVASLFADGEPEPVTYGKIHIDVVWDPTASITITAPAEYSAVSGDVTVTVVIESNHPVDYVHYQVVDRATALNIVDLGVSDEAPYSFVWDVSEYEYPAWELLLDAELKLVGQTGYTAVDAIPVDITVDWETVALDDQLIVSNGAGRLTAGTLDDDRLILAYVSKDPNQGNDGERLMACVEQSPGSLTFDSYIVDTVPPDGSIEDLSFAYYAGTPGITYQRETDYSGTVIPRLHRADFDGATFSITAYPGADAYVLGVPGSSTYAEDYYSQLVSLYKETSGFSVAYGTTGSWTSTPVWTLGGSMIPQQCFVEAPNATRRAMLRIFDPTADPELKYSLYYTNFTGNTSIIPTQIEPGAGWLSPGWLGTAYVPGSCNFDGVFNPAVFYVVFDEFSRSQASSAEVNIAVPGINGFSSTALEYCQQSGYNYASRHGLYGDAIYLPGRDKRVAVYFSGVQSSIVHSYDHGTLKAAFETPGGFELVRINDQPGGMDISVVERSGRVVVLYPTVDEFEDLTVTLSLENIE